MITKEEFIKRLKRGFNYYFFLRNLFFLFHHRHLLTSDDQDNISEILCFNHISEGKNNKRIYNFY